jgi:hypothetical protein
MYTDEECDIERQDTQSTNSIDGSNGFNHEQRGNSRSNAIELGERVT